MLNFLFLNIEGDNHYDLLFPFLSQQNPDVFCAVEVCKRDIPQIQQTGNFSHVTFVPLLSIEIENANRLSPNGEWGMAIFSRSPLRNIHHTYYVKHGVGIPYYEGKDNNEPDRALLWGTIEKDGEPYTMAVTHFIWSLEGAVTPAQESALKDLLTLLVPIPEVILCGDFNAPRGRSIFDTLATHYTDNIPPDVRTTLDPSLHKAGKRLPDLLVDGLFTSPAYTASNVQVIPGVSDHCALTAQISYTSYVQR